jgi:hypothetical protein
MTGQLAIGDIPVPLQEKFGVWRHTKDRPKAKAPSARQIFEKQQAEAAAREAEEARAKALAAGEDPDAMLAAAWRANPSLEPRSFHVDRSLSRVPLRTFRGLYPSEVGYERKFDELLVQDVVAPYLPAADGEDYSAFTSYLQDETEVTQATLELINVTVDQLDHNRGGLRHLKFTNIGLACAQLRMLAGALKHNRRTDVVTLSRNAIGNIGARALASVLGAPNDKIVAVYLGGNKVGDKGAAAFAEALARPSCALTSLNLSGRTPPVKDRWGKWENNAANETRRAQFCIGAAGAAALAYALAKNDKLTELHLNDQMLGDGGAEALAALLRVNTTVTFLGLRGNGIECDGARTFANALAHNRTLISLDLAQNEVTEECVARFARSMRANPILRDIDLSNNLITDKGARVLARALAARPLVTRVSSYGNLMSDAAMGLIDGATDSVRAKLTYAARKHAMKGKDLLDLKILANDPSHGGVRRRSLWKREFAPRQLLAKTRAVAAFQVSMHSHSAEEGTGDGEAGGGGGGAGEHQRGRAMTLMRKGRKAGPKPSALSHMQSTKMLRAGTDSSRQLLPAMDLLPGRAGAPG